ncbi:putative 60S ribosomal protein L28e [Colletotrichum spinosum]|uniref:Putative 60S ribosomal protein L28e n=2 Tax=Colletotrichum orbiculare species complex TaxID=2707354 RepID=A0A4V3HXH5_COLTR|nr:putative 60S ribosomal protein L28e [Colletotrichum spinosum]TDZ74369.1 putative 60S ribosomal protein L28e [Colletotrichum trifolii]
MAAAALPNVSSDLIWEVVRSQNAFLVKRSDIGNLQLSRDPLNLTNKHSRKYAGFVNDKAIGVVPNEKGGVQVVSKNQKNGNKPAKATSETTFGGNKSARKTYKAVALQAAKDGYRADLREAAVQRVSAIRRSQKAVKPEAEKKPRGVKAKAAAAKTEA